MAAEFIIAGRRPLPAHEGSWEMLLESEEGALEVYECGARYDDPRGVATEVGTSSARSETALRSASQDG